ncbi:hypothetical protein L1D14_07575 [Vibrio tubiashii]|uniref:hypothetical protein n=1 Tax=Vibrio tubiashii TaxID=29498 RepID=UPI001EFC5BA3|nr:hypothetical protein [Vibrio tubiashii]MCG9576098.1 hypothetical protein [Vibrio tubiashii]
MQRLSLSSGVELVIGAINVQVEGRGVSLIATREDTQLYSTSVSGNEFYYVATREAQIELNSAEVEHLSKLLNQEVQPVS